MDAEDEGILNGVLQVRFLAQRLTHNRDQPQSSGKDLHQSLGNAPHDKQMDGCHSPQHRQWTGLDHHEAY